MMPPQLRDLAPKDPAGKPENCRKDRDCTTVHLLLLQQLRSGVASQWRRVSVSDCAGYVLAALLIIKFIVG